MNLATARVIEVVEIAPGLFMLWFEAAEVTRLAHPGQFLMVQCGDGLDPYLARPFSFSASRQNASRTTEHALLLNVVGRGTDWLARRRSGDSLSLFGPLGRSLTIRSDTRNLLLIANGVRVAPMIALAEQAVAREVNVTLVQGVSPEEPVYPASLLPPQVEVVIADAGSDGRATADRLAEYLLWSDQVFVAGAEPLLRQVAADLKGMLSKRSVQAVVWQPLLCGTGICGGCAIETRRHGSRLVCRDGPRFELRDLY